MPKKLILAALVLGLFAGTALLWSSLPAAEPSPQKSPMPSKPAPPAKPKEEAKPKPAAKPAEPHVTELLPPMTPEALQAGLAKKVDLELKDSPLAEAVAAIKAQTKLEIRVAADAADDNAAKPTDPAPVASAHWKGISAACALDLLTHDFGLTWTVDRGTVLITGTDRLPESVEVYDVRDLVLAHPRADSHDDPTDFDYDSLIDLVTGVIQSPTWSGDVTTVQDCNPFHGTLTIHQDWRVQQRMAGLLAALRKSREWKINRADPTVNRGLAVTTADNAAVEAALAANVTIDLKAAKLDDVVEWLRQKAGIPVHVDSAAEAAATDTQTFTIHAAGVPLRDVLSQLLPQGKLDWLVQDEALVVTTDDVAAESRTIRVYPVGDLIVGDVERGDVDNDYAQLLDVVTHNVAPESWATLSRAKSSDAYAAYLPTGRAIVCDQTRQAHEAIAAALGRMRSAVAQQATGDAAPTAAKPAAGSEKASLALKIYKLNPDLPADDFVKVVSDLVEPGSWAGEAYIHGVPGSIVVRQTPAMQRRVEKMLINLGAIPDPKKSAPSGTPTLISTRKPL